jgi:hypothetical protein
MALWIAGLFLAMTSNFQTASEQGELLIVSSTTM